VTYTLTCLICDSGAVGDALRGDWRRPVADAAFALLLTFFGIMGTWGAGKDPGPGETPLSGTAFLLVILAALSLAVRRRWPLVTLTVTVVCTSLYLVMGYAYGPILLFLMIAEYTVARYVPTRKAVIWSAAALVFLLGHLLFSRGHAPGWFGLAPASAWMVVPFAGGLAVRLHRDAIARDRAEFARRHADEERLRVAQEVHDVVSHGLSAIAMQADIALHVLPKQPEQAVAALSAISRTSREALDELRVTLAVVRRDLVPGAREPLPGLAQLDALVARTRDSGLAVTVEIEGERRALGSAVDLAAYRIVQESLTNALRHAGPASATVRVGFLDGEVVVEVSDTGRGSADRRGHEPDGQGIAGMRTRVAALGGSFTAAPAEHGGFRVVARLPTT